jgi:hypothetical protein
MTTPSALHTWMSAAIVVTDTPFFAFIDGVRGFKIKPCRRYIRDEAWHEWLGSPSGSSHRAARLDRSRGDLFDGKTRLMLHSHRTSAIFF